MAGHTVVVSVLADTKKFSRAMKKIGDETGLSKLAEGAKKLGRAAKTAVKTVAGLGLAVAALAIKGGIERALKIEEAEAKLKGLGYAGKEIDGIMDDALKSVKGTAFGLDEAATTAATAMAAGVKQGNDLEKYLTLVGDAATIAGTEMGEMGSIFNKVQANGKLMTQNLNQLQDRGIPVLGWLSEEYGVTQEAMSKMVTEGKVDAETFRKVMEDNLGGAAQESGNTTQGAFKNMMAALSRAGLSIVNDIFPLFKDAFGWITELLDDLPARLEPIGKAAQKWIKNTLVPAFKSFGEWLKNTGVPALKNFAGWVKDNIVPIIKSLVNWVAKKLIPALKNLMGWIVDNKDWLTALAIVVGTIVAGIQAYIKVMAIWKAATTAAKAVQAAFNSVMAANPIGLIVLAIAALVAGLTYFFTQTETGQRLWEGFVNFLKDAWDAIVDAFNAAIDWIVDLMQGLWDFIKKVWEWHPLGMIIKNWDAIVDAFKKGWETVKKWMQALWDFVKKVWSYSPIGLITGNWDKITGAFSRGYNTVKSWLQKAWDFIKKVWEYSPLGMITSNWDKIMNFFRKIPDKLRRIFSGVKDAIGNAFKAAFNGVARFWNNTMGRISFTVPSWVPGAGGKGWGFPTIPMLAKGGIVDRATLAMIGEAGPEAVIPLGKLDKYLNGSSRPPVVYNITVEAGVGDPIAIGRQIQSYISDYERAGGRR